MTQLDDELRQATIDLVAELGKDIEFRVAVEAYDVTTGATTALSVSWVTRKCTPPSQYQISRDGSPDKLLETLGTLLPAQGLTFLPKVDQVVRFDNAERRVVKVAPIYSGDLVCAYVLELSA